MQKINKERGVWVMYWLKNCLYTSKLNNIFVDGD